MTKADRLPYWALKSGSLQLRNIQVLNRLCRNYWNYGDHDEHRVDKRDLESVDWLHESVARMFALLRRDIDGHALWSRILG